MKIMESSLQSQASSLQWTHTRREESLSMELRLPPAPARRPQVELSPQALKASSRAEESAPSGLDMKLQLLISIVESLTGERIRFFDAADLEQQAHDASEAPPQEPPASQTPAAAPREAAEFSIHYESRSIREEAELSHYAASGSVVTADGRQISFAVDLEMARYEYEESSQIIDIGTPRKKDPLVLNLNTAYTRLETERFDFDLDADGATEQVAKLGSGSFFIALDRNANGEIDSGKDLFGTQSGNGFADLAAFDQDGNGWIDESDAVFSQLQLWRPDEEAISLEEAGVGAIALERRATPFTLKDETGQVAGAIRSTGLYLAESGRAGTVQQIDLVV